MNYKISEKEFVNELSSSITEILYNLTADSANNLLFKGKQVGTSGIASSTTNGLMSKDDKVKLDGATSANTAGKIVARDNDGNFSAKTITASLNGNAATATKLSATKTINGVAFDGSSNITIADSTKIAPTGTIVTGRVPVFNDTTGKVIKDSGFTIASSVPSNAKFTDTVYVHPTNTGNKHIPSGGSSGQILRWSADGAAVWASENNTMYSLATTTLNGLMSSTDKTKLDGVATGANNYTHPATHPATMISGLNKIATSGSYNDLLNKPTTFPPSAHTHIKSQISDFPSSLPANGGNADTVDGKHATDFANASHGNHVPSTQSENNAVFLRNDNTWQTVNPDSIGAARGAQITGTTAATAGWYRIAQSGASITNNIGEFHIRASASGVHSSSIITAGITYGQNPALQQISHTRYSGDGITKARIVYHTTYSDNRAYLEVYVPTAAARTIVVQLEGTLGWSLLSPSTAGSIPSGYTSNEITLATGKIVSDINGTVNGYSISKSVPSNAIFTDTVYTHPITSGNKHIPSGGSSGQILRWSADGTAVWGADNNTTYGVVSKTANGLVPKLPDETTSTKYLRQDGTWTVPPNTTYGVATTSENGLMSSADKTKLNSVATGANNYTHPSTHPASMISGLHKVATSGSYNDLTNRPSTFPPSTHTHDDKLSKLIEMPANQSLNQALEFGNYHFSNVTGGYPSGYTSGNNDFILQIVSSGVANTYWQTQLLTDIRSGRVFKRTKLNNVFDNWQAINDGGNADTVDGKHASDFVNFINVSSNIDIDTLTYDTVKTPTIYRGTFKMSSLPSGVGDGQGILIVYPYTGNSGAHWSRQEFMSAHTMHTVWQRSAGNTAYGPWSKVTHIEGDSTITNGYAPHSEGTLTVAIGGTMGSSVSGNANMVYRYISNDNITLTCNSDEWDDYIDYIDVGIAAYFVFEIGNFRETATLQITSMGDSTIYFKLISETLTGAVRNTPSYAAFEPIEKNLKEYRSAHAEGYKTTALDCSHTEGYNTVAYNGASHAEGYSTKATGSSGSHSEGSFTKATGQSSHAEGFSSNASGSFSHAEGYDSTASEYSTHAEGTKTIASGTGAHAEGSNTIASGNYSHAEGGYVSASGDYSHAQGYRTTSETYLANVMGRFNKVNSGSVSMLSSNYNAFVIGNGTSVNAKSNAFRVTFQGATYGLSAFNSSGADYAEFFEWADGNLDNEDRIGKFVTLIGEKIKIAQDTDYILGAVSGQAAVIGNSSDDSWNDMYLRDKYARLQYEEVEVEAEYETIPAIIRTETNEDGENTTVVVREETTMCIKEGGTEIRIKLNPDYDPELEYIPRSERKEWDTIGMLGQLIVDDDGTCELNGFCKCNSTGIATKSDSGYRVLKRIDETTILILFK